MPVLNTRKRKKLLWLVMGLFIGVIISAGICYFYFFNNYRNIIEENETLKAASKLSENENVKREVVFIPVVNNLLEAGTKITKEDIAYIELYEEYSNQDFIKDEDLLIGKCLKVNASKNQPLTQTMLITESDISNDLREMEFSMLYLPQKLDKEDYVDVRISFPTGLDYIILSKKKVVDIQRVDNDTDFKETVWFYLNEEELLRVSSALVDASLVEGTKLYAVEYVEPVLQEKAKVTYPVNNDVLEQLKNNPNLLTEVIQELELKRRNELADSLDKLTQQ